MNYLGQGDKRVTEYFDRMAKLPLETVISHGEVKNMRLENAFAKVIDLMRKATDCGHTTFFIGNGGSAGIASHFAIDYMKNGGIRAQAFNDPVALTCLGNDCGYEQVFSKQVEFHARQGDVLVAISSSGMSKNILNACDTAKRKKCSVITFSGFQPDNALRKKGTINFYVPEKEYGFVECTHMTLLHAILDLSTEGK